MHHPPSFDRELGKLCNNKFINTFLTTKADKGINYITLHINIKHIFRTETKVIIYLSLLLNYFLHCIPCIVEEALLQQFEKSNFKPFYWGGGGGGGGREKFNKG